LLDRPLVPSRFGTSRKSKVGEQDLAMLAFTSEVDAILVDLILQCYLPNRGNVLAHVIFVPFRADFLSQFLCNILNRLFGVASHEDSYRAQIQHQMLECASIWRIYRLWFIG
jgi:hypothetical protein